ncbi:MAG TPA: hypothetical protein VHQ90_04795 [Thermoanaerobaculia bacterium]|nr:hypothetical protein [Thermoanaerobaculia bacterium]
MSSKTELETSVQALLGLSEGELEAELGRRLTQTAEELERNEPLSTMHAAGLTVDREALQSLPEFTTRAAALFLKRFNQQMYSLVCDSTDPDHDKIRSTAAQGAAALGFAISGALVATFGWLPGIASVIAVIIAKRFAKAGYQAVCEAWKEQL